MLQCLNDNKKLFYTMGTVVKTQQQGYIITSRKSFHDWKGKKHKFQHHNKGFKITSFDI